MVAKPRLGTLNKGFPFLIRIPGRHWDFRCGSLYVQSTKSMAKPSHDMTKLNLSKHFEN